MKEPFKYKIKRNTTSALKSLSLLRSTNFKIVFTNGCFDILHTGHLQYLDEARSLGDFLVIGVNDDESVRRLKGKKRPILKLDERMEMLAALQMVDMVVPFSEDTPLNLIKTLKPNVLVKGGDYSVDQIVGADEVLADEGRVEVLSFKEGVSTTYIIDEILKRFG